MSKRMADAKVYVDGKATPNPGVATYGFAVTKYRPGTQEVLEVVEGRGKMVGTRSNNEAEYEGWIRAMSFLVEQCQDELQNVVFYTDSELMYNQNTWNSTGNHRAKHTRPQRRASIWAARTKKPELQRKRLELWDLIERLEIVENLSICLVPRELNAHADLLTNTAMDQLNPGDNNVVTKHQEEDNATTHFQESPSRSATIAICAADRRPEGESADRADQSSRRENLQRQLQS